MEDRQQFYDSFAEKLEQALLQQCCSNGLLEDRLLTSYDIDQRWDKGLGEPFCADAVKEFNGYPEATLSWAAYLGMAVARQWDKDWKRYKDADYASYCGKAGFDDLDEHVTRDILGIPLNSAKAAGLADTLQALACAVISLIRHEGIEYQTIEAYYILLKSLRVMYRIGAALELRELGYKFVPVGE